MAAFDSAGDGFPTEWLTLAAAALRGRGESASTFRLRHGRNGRWGSSETRRPVFFLITVVFHGIVRPFRQQATGQQGHSDPGAKDHSNDKDQRAHASFSFILSGGQTEGILFSADRAVFFRRSDTVSTAAVVGSGMATGEKPIKFHAGARPENKDRLDIPFRRSYIFHCIIIQDRGKYLIPARDPTKEA